jgi:hypothetical protein
MIVKFGLMSKKRILFWIPSIVIGITLGISLQFVHAWVEPNAGAPNANIGAPLTTGGATQNKAGQLNVTGGGAYGSGGLGFGFHSLNSNSNGWLYLGDQWGNVYGGRGIASESLWASGTSYASTFSDANNGSYYVDPNATSRMNYTVFDNLYSYGWEATPINYDSDNWNYYSDPNGTSRMNYGVFDNLYSYGWMQSQWYYDANDNNYYVDPNGNSRLNFGIFDNLYTYGLIRSSWYSDANDSGYYVDPNGNSRMNYVATNTTNNSGYSYTKDIYIRDAGYGKWASQIGLNTCSAWWGGNWKFVDNKWVYVRPMAWIGDGAIDDFGPSGGGDGLYIFCISPDGGALGYSGMCLSKEPCPWG